jgi:hypothetical protein
MVDKKKDYEIGHSRPPEHTRFKKGVSGNPAGRPPRHLSDLVASTLDAPVPVRRGGKPQNMSGFEAGARRLCAQAVKGDLKAALELLRLWEEYKVLTPMPQPAPAGGVVEMPKDWDREEWLSMFIRYGAPPWPGSRSGLTKQREQDLGLNKKRREQ